MELYTQNLFTVTVSHERIQSNFTSIDQALRLINEKLWELSQSQISLSGTVGANNSLINTLERTVNKQTQIVKKHEEFIEQLQGEEENSEDKASEARKYSEQELLRISEHKETHLEGLGSLSVERLPQANDDSLKTKEISEDKVKKALLGQNKSKGAKTGFQKMFSSLKERIFNLQRDNQEKETIMLELKKMIQKNKAKESQHQTRKPPLELIKKSNSKKSIFDEKGRSSFYIQQERQLSSKSIPPSEHQQLSDLNSTLNINQNLNQGSDLLPKDIGSVRDSLMEKIRVIEAQFKESQNRVQTVEKTVDILERSHEMLKYDFDRTSTSWSKNRSADTHDKQRNQGKLSDTRMTSNVREFYEEKIVELFNDLDSFKKEYLQLHSKLTREDELSDGSSGLRSPTNSKDKFNTKTVSSLKMQGNEQKKEMSLFKRQLAKLREDFDEFAWGVNTSTGNETKTVVIKPNENKEDWKILSTKIYKLRMELQSGLRDLEGKIATNNDMVVVLNGLEVGIEECRLLMKRKVQYNDYQKGLKRLEGRLNNFIMQVYEKESKENEVDAALSKQPWFCLSCDSEVKNYNTRSNKSPVKEKLVGRKVNPQNHMVRRNENGRLPSVLK